MPLSESPNRLRVTLDLPNDAAGMVGIRYASSKCKMQLQDRIGSKPNLVFLGQLVKTDRFIYFGSCT